MRFSILDIARIALSTSLVGLGLAVLPGRGRLTQAVNSITTGIDQIAAEVRRDHE